MAKNSQAKLSLPAHCEKLLQELGERIRIARKRRGMSMADLAIRMLSSSRTVQRLEKGEPGVSLGILVTALLCLGLENDLARVAAMETDSVAFAHDRRRLLDRKRQGRKRREMTPEEEFFAGHSGTVARGDKT